MTFVEASGVYMKKNAPKYFPRSLLLRMALSCDASTTFSLKISLHSMDINHALMLKNSTLKTLCMHRIASLVSVSARPSQ